MNWQRTKKDGCTILRSGDYEIAQNYEEGWQLSWHGCALNRLGPIKSMREAKAYADEHARFN